MSDLSINADKLLQVGEADKDHILKKYDMNRDTLKECIDSIKEWYKTQEHLPQGALDDTLIFTMLRKHKFLLERVKNAIDDHFTFRSRLLDFSDTWDIMDKYIQEVFDKTDWFILPKKTSKDHRIIITRIARKDIYEAPKYTIIQWAMMAYMISDYLSRNDINSGMELIIDFSNKVALQTQLLQVTLTDFRRVMSYAIKGFSFKVKVCHIVGLPHIISDGLFAIFKAVLPEKLTSRIQFHKTFDDLRPLFENSIFPIDFGGEAPSSNELTAELRATLCSDPWRKWFMDQAKIKCDETKRLKPRLDSTDMMYGASGSFKTLNID